jgi:transcriptional regulator with XRE-family HTH domain
VSNQVSAYDRMKRFGEKLRTLRKRNGLTQKQVGDMLDVSRVYIVQLEKGQKIPNAAMILKIADIFGVCTDKLMRDELELD